ncbi:MAG: cell envelope integrity protein TolA [Anaerolineales bacterium]|nr:MAG: cell envelope integrity protein TolA [Anaerolineales bacterium]
MSKQTSLTDELTGNIQTDHGGFGFGDLIVILLDLALLIYTGFRSYDFLTNTVPDGWQMLALVGLWGLDIGAIAWSLVWIFGSTEKYQDWVSMTFFVVDLVGVVLTSLTDSLMYGAKGGVTTQTLTGVSVVVVPLVVVLNVVAGFIYHMTSPATKAQRAKRRADAEHRAKMEELAQMERDLTYAEQYLLKRQDTLDKSAFLAQMKVEQDAVEKATREALRDQAGIADVARGGTSGAADKLAQLKECVDALKSNWILPDNAPAPAPAPAHSEPTSQAADPVKFAAILMRANPDDNGMWWRATVLDTNNESLFLTGVNLDREMILNTAKVWCYENGYTIQAINRDTVRPKPEPTHHPIPSADGAKQREPSYHPILPMGGAAASNNGHLPQDDADPI